LLRYFTDFICSYFTQIILPAIKLLAPLSGANLICIPYFHLSHSWVHEWWYHSWNRPVHGWYCPSMDGAIPRMGQNSTVSITGHRNRHHNSLLVYITRQTTRYLSCSTHQIRLTKQIRPFGGTLQSVMVTHSRHCKYYAHLTSLNPLYLQIL
jgi:hypothetical protein